MKNISGVSEVNEWNVFHHKKRNFVSLRGHVLFYFKYYINTTQNTKPFYFFICIYIHFLAAKGAIYYVAIAKVIFSTANVVYVSGGEDNVWFSCAKISCFRAKAHLVFHWCLSGPPPPRGPPFPPGVYIIKFNRPFARWRHLTTTSRILFVFLFIF